MCPDHTFPREIVSGEAKKDFGDGKKKVRKGTSEALKYKMLSIIFLIIGFVLLIKGADLLVDGASSIARRFKVSDLVIGLTVVAFGTSSPELVVNIMASARGNTDIAIGNILGSNIANTFLILGVSAVIYPLTVSRGTVWKEIPFSLLAAVLLGLLANDQLIDKKDFSTLTRIDGLVLLSFFVIFLYYSFTIAREIEGMKEHVPEHVHGLQKALDIAPANIRPGDGILLSWPWRWAILW